MFEVFPIINLIDQQNAINQAIRENVLTRQDVLHWLQWYGTVKWLRYPERILVTPSNTIEIADIVSKNEKHLFVYKHNFGHFDVFNFVEEVSEFVVMGRGWIRSYIYK